jgi:acyl-CoA synthetase (NDP forming)
MADGLTRIDELQVYRLLERSGGIAPPTHRFVAPDEDPAKTDLDGFTDERVVLKIVSPDVVHKSDAGGVVVCRKDDATVAREIESLHAKHRGDGSRVEGVLVVEFIEHDPTIGHELFVGVRRTREFGPVIAAGLGGTDTEYFATQLPRSIARAVVGDASPEDFLETFKHTAAYDLVAGRVRGHEKLVDDTELLRVFTAFFAIADQVEELEVNPFCVRDGTLVPLDGRGVGAEAPLAPQPRPIEQIKNLLEPETIAVLGVSAKSRNFGRIILDNIIESGYPHERISVVKGGTDRIGGVRCAPSIKDLLGVTDLLVIAASGDQLPGVIEECVESGRVRSGIVIPGGAGETEGSGGILESVRATLAVARSEGKPTPVLVGPNCLGVQSRPGPYDTFFVPDSKVAKRYDQPPRGVALISQSGAFIVSRLSTVPTLDPMITVSIGNQGDLTIGDVVGAMGDRDDVHTIGVYVEGFNDGDGLATMRAIRALTEAGRTVVFYKAGRTEQGRDAAAGHTASLAGDYDVCAAGAESAGALVAETFAEFEHLLELSACLHEKRVGGPRLGAMSNAGFETVGIADRIGGLSLAEFDADTRASIAEALDQHKLSTLVNVRNPLDLTPMAGIEPFEACARALLASDDVDAMLLSAVPLTPAMPTTADEIESGESMGDVFGRLQREFDKPIIAVVDAGARYEPLVEKIRDHGVPVLRSADDAVRCLGRYQLHRLR